MLRENKLDRGIRLFDSPWLDALSRVHPALPGLFYGPLCLTGIAWGLWLGTPVLSACGWLLGGYAFWTLSEYLIHRFLFHFHPRNPRLQEMFYYIHEHHHRYQEKDRLLAPPLLSVTFMLVFLALFYATIGTTMGAGPMLVFSAGFGLGYLAYDYTHYYIHFARPASRHGRFLRRCHLQHHFARPDRWFCVSCPWVDFLFGTQWTAHRAADIDEQEETNQHTSPSIAVGPKETQGVESRQALPPKVVQYEQQRAAQGAG